ncbi:MAG: PGPGW domain-containing protein [Thermoanaerobaculia bacterium]
MRTHFSASNPPEPRPETSDPPREVEHEEEHRPLPALPVAVRLILLIVGWLLLLVGIAGLVLPGIQGIFTLVVAAAVLSLVSEFVYRNLRRGLQRWPRVWQRIERFRRWLHEKLSPRDR